MIEMKVLLFRAACSSGDNFSSSCFGSFTQSGNCSCLTGGFVYLAYLKYIKLNDWYHPQELFRWIRDERFNDEYDLSETTTQARYTNPPVRQEQLPDWVNEPKQEEEKLRIQRNNSCG
jgi:hypothetical protein